MPASLAERRAFLLAIFRSDMIHRTYIQEKVELALAAEVSGHDFNRTAVRVDGTVNT